LSAKNTTAANTTLMVAKPNATPAFSTAPTCVRARQNSTRVGLRTFCDKSKTENAPGGCLASVTRSNAGYAFVGGRNDHARSELYVRRVRAFCDRSKKIKARIRASLDQRPMPGRDMSLHCYFE
jgi:hypothetical protein